VEFEYETGRLTLHVVGGNASPVTVIVSDPAIVALPLVGDHSAGAAVAALAVTANSDAVTASAPISLLVVVAILMLLLSSVRQVIWNWKKTDGETGTG
jgi:hypothetical protein